MAMLTGSIRLAGLIALIGFYALHVPVWGWGFALGGLVSGAGAMAFFIWRKDLLAMMVFRVVEESGAVLRSSSTRTNFRNLPGHPIVFQLVREQIVALCVAIAFVS